MLGSNKIFSFLFLRMLIAHPVKPFRCKLFFYFSIIFFSRFLIPVFLQDKSCVAEFPGHKYGINCVAFAPNNKYIVSVSQIIVIIIRSSSLSSLYHHPNTDHHQPFPPAFLLYPAPQNLVLFLVKIIFTLVSDKIIVTSKSFSNCCSQNHCFAPQSLVTIAVKISSCSCVISSCCLRTDNILLLIIVVVIVVVVYVVER